MSMSSRREAMIEPEERAQRQALDPSDTFVGGNDYMASLNTRAILIRETGFVFTRSVTATGSNIEERDPR